MTPILLHRIQHYKRCTLNNHSDLKRSPVIGVITHAYAGLTSILHCNILPRSSSLLNLFAHNSIIQLTTTSSSNRRNRRQVETMMSSMSSEQYEVMYTLRSEIFAKQGGSFIPGPFDGPRGFGRSWMRMDLTPAERDVFMKYRRKGKQLAAVGGLVGGSAMAGVWKMAALGRGMGITGVIVGSVIGAGVSMRSSGIRREMVTEMLKLPSEKSQRAAQAREILQTKLQHNAFAQELLKESGFDK